MSAQPLLFGSAPEQAFDGVHRARDGERIDGDAYYTRPGLCRAGLLLLRDLLTELQREAGRPLRVLEPSVGAGGHLRAVLDFFPDAEVWAVDQDPTARGLAIPPTTGGESLVGDWLVLAREHRERWFGYFDLIVGNPPFAVATPHVVAALELRALVTQLILPIDFQSSADRIDFWARYTGRCSDVWHMAQRTSWCSEGGSANQNTSLYRWLATPQPVMASHPGWDWQTLARYGS